MEQDYKVTNEPIASSEALTLPHFQEEVTLLAARPVVPLKKIKNRDLRQPWVLGLALVAAVLLGALTATLIVYSQQGRPDQTVGTEATEPSSDYASKDAFASAFSGAEGLAKDSEEAPVLTVEKPNDPKTHIATVAASASTKKDRAPQIARSAPQPIKARSVSQEEIFMSEKEMRRAERRETRRRPPDSERGRRNRSSNELLRIREIFEGPVRP